MAAFVVSHGGERGRTRADSGSVGGSERERQIKHLRDGLGPQVAIPIPESKGDFDVGGRQTIGFQVDAELEMPCGEVLALGVSRRAIRTPEGGQCLAFTTDESPAEGHQFDRDAPLLIIIDE
jgi:hypothetical protein